MFAVFNSEGHIELRSRRGDLEPRKVIWDEPLKKKFLDELTYDEVRLLEDGKVIRLGNNDGYKK